MKIAFVISVVINLQVSLVELLMKLYRLNALFDQNVMFTVQYIFFFFKYTVSVWYTSTLFSILPEKHLLTYQVYYFGWVEKPFFFIYSLIVDVNVEITVNEGDVCSEITNKRKFCRNPIGPLSDEVAALWTLISEYTRWPGFWFFLGGDTNKYANVFLTVYKFIIRVTAKYCISFIFWVYILIVVIWIENVLFGNSAVRDLLIIVSDFIESQKNSRVLDDIIFLICLLLCIYFT